MTSFNSGRLATMRKALPQLVVAAVLVNQSVAFAYQNYEIVNLQSGKVLDATGGSSSQAYQNGTPIQQWDWVGGANQQWKVLALGNGYSLVVSLQSGKVLDVTGGSGSQAYQNGTLIQQWDWVGGANQQWQVLALGNGYNLIVSLQSGKVLDVTGGSSSQAYQNGTQIQQWDWWGGGANQQWQLIQVDGSNCCQAIPAPPPPVPSIYAFQSTSSGVVLGPGTGTPITFYCYYPDTGARHPIDLDENWGARWTRHSRYRQR
jgi:hypothetical protein